MDPFTNPSSDGTDYSISGTELLGNGDVKIYEIKETLKVTQM